MNLFPQPKAQLVSRPETILRQNSRIDRIRQTSLAPNPKVINEKTFLSDLIDLRRDAATGCLTIRSGICMWFLFFDLGSLIWANSHEHQGRRWQRQYTRARGGKGKTLCSLSMPSPTTSNPCWDYELSCSLLQQNILSEKEIGKLASGTIREVIFDILQAIAARSQKSKITEPFVVEWDAEMRPSEDCAMPLHWLEPAEGLLGKVWQQWSAWRQAKLISYSPNKAPRIVDVSRLRSQTTERAFSVMAQLFDGHHTLRDAAVSMQKDLHQVMLPLIPLLFEGIVSLEKISDRRPGQRSRARSTRLPKVPVARLQGAQQKLSVFCIDDNVQSCELVKHIVEDAGYHCRISQQPLQALGLCAEIRPDLIFLDLAMPGMNGCELCAHLRRVEAFKSTPIIFLSNRDSVRDKVRAKLSGATDFLTKPIVRDRIMAVLEEYVAIRAR